MVFVLPRRGNAQLRHCNTHFVIVTVTPIQLCSCVLLPVITVPLFFFSVCTALAFRERPKAAYN